MTGRSELNALRFCVSADAAAALLCLCYSATALPEDAHLPAGFAVVAGVPWVLAVLAALAVPFRRPGLLRGLARTVSVSFVVSLAALVVAMACGAWPERPLPWLVLQTSVAIGTAVAGWGRGLAVFGAVAVFALLETLRAVDHDLTRASLVDDSHNLILAGFTIVLTAQFIAASRDHDRAVRRAADTVATAAAATARRRARERTETLVHDEVFTLLLAAGRGPGTDVRAQAIATARLIRDLDAGPIEVPVTTLADRLRAVVTAAAPHARVSVPDGVAVVPDEVANTLVEAVAQAVANSVRHAGGAGLTLTLTADDGVRIVVADEGPGFRLDAVPSDRMGISLSILRRVNDMPGATATVESRPGRGTTVTVTWLPPERHIPAPRVVSPRPIAPPSPGPRLPAARVILMGFLLIQILLAATVVLAGGSARVAALGLVGIAAGALALGWRDAGPSSTRRSLLVVTLCCGVAALGWVPQSHAALAADWYLTGVAFVIALLVARGRALAGTSSWRPMLAALGMAAAVTLTVTGFAAHAEHPGPHGQTFTSPVLIVLWALGSTTLIRFLRARTARIVESELADLDRTETDIVRLAEMRRASLGLTVLLGPILDRLAQEHPVTEDEARECLALEGHLRDQYRGGRLARQPLVDAARDARRRGADVVLLDDAPDRDLSEQKLDEVARWMTTRLGDLDGEEFTGRLLPTGRDGIASAVTEGGIALFR